MADATPEELQTQIQYALVERLSKNELRQTKLLSLLDECIFECDLQFNLTYVNPAWEQHIGLPINTLINTDLRDLLADLTDLRAFENYLNTPGGDKAVELKLACQGGKTTWFELRFVELEAPHQGFIGSLFDIHEHKEMEAKLRMQEQHARQLSLVASHTNNLVIIADRSGRIEWVNSSFENHSGYHLKDIIGRKPGDLLQGPETDPDTIQIMSDAIEQGLPFKVEIANYNARGELYWVAIDATPVMDCGDSVSRFIAVETDITHRVITEQAAAQNTYNYRSVLNNMREVVLKLDSCGNMTFINQAWATMIGSSVEACQGNAFTDYVNSFYVDLVVNALGAYHDGERENTTLDIQISRVDGTPLWVEMTMTPLQGIGPSNLESVAVTLVDIDDRVKSTRALQNAKHQAEKIADTKSRFLANVSHEIRTPLNAIIGSIDILSDTALDREQSHFVSLVKTSSQALHSIIDDVLTFSRFEAGKLPLHPEAFDLASCLDDVIDICSQQAIKKKLHLILDVAPEVPFCVSGDKARLRQILTNLVSNAIKFTHEGEVVLSVGYTQQDKDKGELHIAVKDTGIGIGKSKQENIFQPFVQSDTSTTRQYGGSGLGLAICQQICEAAGGSIGVESEPGVGSTFTAIFPVQHHLTEKPLTTGFNKVWLAGRNTSLNRAVSHLIDRYEVPIDTIDNAISLSDEDIATSQGLLVITDPELDIMDHHKANNPHLRKVVIDLLSPMDIVKPSILSGEKSTRLNGPLKINSVLGAISNDMDCRDDGKVEELAGVSTTDKSTQYIGQTVLVVEDNLNNQNIIRHHLENRGCEVLVVEHGAAALTCLENNDIDLVLMDIQMPVMDGPTTTRHIRSAGKSYSQIPIIAVTANAVEGDRERFLKAGMNDYLSKPIRRQGLYTLLDKYLLRGVTQSSSEGKISRLRHAHQQIARLRETTDCVAICKSN
ncbi:MAG TPA: hybrid sensor histidine kinase/response regulator [Porticoccaceae bacterium]|nr:hybrid sensor histidine kinase/response regulator [Porticoccaceae bacterium]